MDKEVYDLTEYPSILITEDTDHTCSSDGCPGQYFCEVCGGYFSLRVRDNHTLGEVESSLPATCTEDGWIDYACKVCGETIREEIKATGHDYTFEVLQAPALDSTGKLLVYCARCGEKTEIALPVLNEKDYAKQQTLEASCVSKGEAIYTYVNETYGVVYKVTAVIPEKGHSEYVEGTTQTYTWIIDNAEYTGYLCENCNYMIVINVKEMESSVYGLYAYSADDDSSSSLSTETGRLF